MSSRLLKWRALFFPLFIPLQYVYEVSLPILNYKYFGSYKRCISQNHRIVISTTGVEHTFKGESNVWLIKQVKGNGGNSTRDTCFCVSCWICTWKPCGLWTVSAQGLDQPITCWLGHLDSISLSYTERHAGCRSWMAFVSTEICSGKYKDWEKAGGISPSSLTPQVMESSEAKSNRWGTPEVSTARSHEAKGTRPQRPRLPGRGGSQKP